MRFRPFSGRTVPMSGLLQRVGVALVLVTVLMPRPAEAYVTRVDASGTRFTPARVEIELDDSVIWEAGDDGHTVTAADGSFDSSSRGFMSEGDQFRWRFRVPGTYAYFCRVHQNRGMKGEIVVVDPDAPTTSSTRLTPVTAAATTSTTALAATETTVSTEPPTTTSRVLATSSTTSPAMATSTTAPVGTPVAPQEPPALNPSAPVLGSADGRGSGDAKLPDAQAAAQQTSATDNVLPVIALGVVAVLALFGGMMGLRARRRRA